MAEAFGRAMTNVYNKKRISRVMVTNNMPNITHQKFADDTILPRKSLVQEALCLKNIIKLYMEVSCQKVNESKSKIFFINTNQDLEQKYAS